MPDEILGLPVILAIVDTLDESLLSSLNEEESRHIILEVVKDLQELKDSILGYWISEEKGKPLLDAMPDPTKLCEVYRYQFSDQDDKCILCPLYNTGSGCKQPANLILRYRFAKNLGVRKNLAKQIIKEITKRSAEIDEAIGCLDPEEVTYVDEEYIDMVTENEWEGEE